MRKGYGVFCRPLRTTWERLIDAMEQLQMKVRKAGAGG